MTWKDIETRIDNGARNLIFVTKPMGNTFRVYNYSGNCDVNSILCLFNVWGSKASCSFLYKDKFEVVVYELSTEIYDFFNTAAMATAFDRIGVSIFFQEELEEKRALYNGKVVCIKSMYITQRMLTKGKIYEFKNGFSRYDNGDRVPFVLDAVTSFEDLEERLPGTFIELVED